MTSSRLALFFFNLTFVYLDCISMGRVRFRFSQALARAARTIGQTPAWVSDTDHRGSLEAWTGMWEAEPARRADAAATDPAHGYRLANNPQSE
jgi:hypothetical protein